MKKEKYKTHDVAHKLGYAIDGIIRAQKDASAPKAKSRLIAMVEKENVSAAKAEKNLLIFGKSNKFLSVSLLLLASIYTTGCSGMIGENLFTSDKGRFLLSTDGEGMRQFSSALNGLVTTGKASPDVKDAYWHQQEKEVGVKVMRFQVLNNKEGENE
jgi:hypothetical protein